MDPRLVALYESELDHLRETGAEFAEQFPKIAARLGMRGLEVADPYVERLLEGVAFLAARVQLKLNAEFPRFTQALLEIVYPHYLAPTPSMLIAQLKPDLLDPALTRGPLVPRGATLVGTAGADETTGCEFRTAHDVALWPIELVSATYFTFAPDLPLNTLPVAARVRGGVRLRLRTTAGVKFKELALDRLPIYLGGREEVANRLHELMLGGGLGVAIAPGTGGKASLDFVPGSMQPVGFSDEESLLPVTLRSFQGYRLLQEYFACPQRFRFVAFSGLARALARRDTEEIELVVLLGRGDPSLESLVDASNFLLFCTPAVNLFQKRADRIHVTDESHEYHVLPDRTRPLDFEVHSVTQVVGHGLGSDDGQPFLPFYEAYSADESHRQSAYFTVRREPRLVSDTARRRGLRSNYVGTEVFLGLVDAAQAPFSGDVRQLSIETWCTNRDLPLQMAVGPGANELTLNVAAPIASIGVVIGPTRPHGPLVGGFRPDQASAAVPGGETAWRAVSHLALNYLSLTESTPQDGAAALRDLLELYVPAGDVSARRQVEGIRSVAVRRVVRRLPGPGPLAFGRGLEITVHVDDLAFQGASAFLLGSVLDRYFARHVSINTFTETVMQSDVRPDIGRWAQQWGTRPTL